MSNEKNKAEGVEEASSEYMNLIFLRSTNEPVYKATKQACKQDFIAGAHWQRNDPDFIAEIVEKTLAMVAENAHMTYTTNPEITFDSNPSGYRTIVIDRVGILAMHPDIVNQILKEKV